MIYLFAGDDATKKLHAYEKFMQPLSQKTETFPISRNNFDPMQIESLYSGSGLFSAKSTVVFADSLERQETRDFVLSKLDLMQESGNDFIFLEGKLKKPELDAFKKARAELNVFELPKEAKEKFNSFILANALGNRDKLNLWINFRQAMEAGVSMEELVGILFWKAKDMILKKNYGKFKEQELKDFASKVSYLLPSARREGKDDEAAFEQFLLDAF